MITTAVGTGAQASCQEMPEESMRVIAEGLTKRGLTVSITGCEDSRRLKVTGTGNARGMTVTLDVMPDEETYSAFVAIVITNPACPERGTVHLEKNWVCWECYGGEITGGPAELAGTVADVLTQRTPHRS